MQTARILALWTSSWLIGSSPACSSSNAPAADGGGAVVGGSASDGSTQAANGGTGAAGAGADAGSSSGHAGNASCHESMPGPDNTGVPRGTVLQPSGSIQVVIRGAVIEDLAIDGEITVLADDVTIRRVHIRSGDYYPIRYFDNGNHGLIVEDSEIEGTSDDVTAALSFANYTARRLNVHGGADGFKADANVLIEDCWIHDLRNGPGQHNDGVQSTGGKGVTIRHNAISGASNACVQTGDEGGATEDLIIECNWLSGGGYSLNIRGTGSTRPKNTRIVDNRFTRDSAYGPWTIDDPNPTVTGNAYDDGTPLAYQ